MKFVNLLLAFYFIVLSGIPCSDQASCSDEEKIVTGLNISIHEHAEGELDFCSPFCICNCCHNQINQPGYFYFQTQLPGFSDLNSSIQQHSVKFITASIWQPPRLS